MATINVQFSDATEQAVISYFASPQDSESIPNAGQVDASDARWKSFYAAQPNSAQMCLPAPPA